MELSKRSHDCVGHLNWRPSSLGTGTKSRVRVVRGTLPQRSSRFKATAPLQRGLYLLRRNVTAISFHTSASPVQPCIRFDPSQSSRSLTSRKPMAPVSAKIHNGKSEHRTRHHVGPDAGDRKGATMQTPEEYRKYAEECERLARMGPQDKADIMLAIANAWRQRAEEAQLRQRSPVSSISLPRGRPRQGES
jgi:hypothetical protein